MKRPMLALGYLLLMLAGGLPASAGDQFPTWAYPVNSPGLKPVPDDGIAKTVPNSTAAFTLTQIRDLFRPPDWHPDNHPVMPDVVGRGKSPGQFACGYCHLPNGLGRPENSSLAGLPAGYIAQQVAEFRSGARKSSEAASLPVNYMIAVAKLVSEEDARIAAEYFAALKPSRWIRVVETAMVPKSKVGGWMLIEDGSGESEAIGERIIEMPEHLERTELRDSTSGFIAYVPPGSIERGRQLASTGGGKTMACTSCHGLDLRGLGAVPGLAGRSPSYVVRQLYDFQHGVRDGQWAIMMKPVVAALTMADIVDLAAYTASLEP